MKMSIKAYATPGQPQDIEAVFKQYAIDMMKKISDYGVEFGHKPLNFEAIPGDWDWVMPESPIELINAVSWGWTVNSETTGASGDCTFYLNAPVKEEYVGRTVLNLERNGSKINLDIMVE